MTDDRVPSPTQAGAAAGRTSTSSSSATATPPQQKPPQPHPSGHSLRRAVTVDESSSFRRRPPISHLATDGSAFEGVPRRRSSNFSDYSLLEARRSLRDDVLNPRPSGVGIDGMGKQDETNWSSLPLAFALLPAIAGLLFQNGSSIVTDVMLLGLAGIFLHWSVTQPWNWYNSAQEIRIREEDEADADNVVDDESESGATTPAEAPLAGPDTVPEKDPSATPLPARVARTEAQSAALRELYWHEMIALLCCFVFPALGAYVLHHIRSQLSRPSEGLVSNYNLSIFLLASELRPLSHLLKLVQSRTLHLHRVVHGSPFKDAVSAKSEQVLDLIRRLEELEARPVQRPAGQSGSLEQAAALREAAVAREVRNAIQPDLDALNRAVRRYEKKATVLAFQTDQRLGVVDMRLNDAIALAAAAAKNSTSQWSVFEWFVDSAAAAIMLPVRVALVLVWMPFRLVASLFKGRKRPGTERTSRARVTRAPGQVRHGGERVSSRLARR